MRRSSQRNPFEVLGVGPEASDQEVKDNFRKAAKKAHPDNNPGDVEAAAARFNEVKAAYERIKSAELRRSTAIELGMLVAAEEGGSSGFNAAFSDFYQTMDSYAPVWRKRYGNVPQTGANITKEVHITLEQAYRGGRFSIEHPAARCGNCHGAGRIPKPGRHQCPTCNGERVLKSAQSRIKVQISCPTCAGRGSVHWVLCAGCGGLGQVPAISASVDIPKGVKSGEEIIVAGCGNPGVAGGTAGDLVVRIRVLEHPEFRRQGDDLLRRVRIDICDAALGSQRTLQAIDGGLVEYVIPPGCQPGTVIRVEEGGMPAATGKGALLLMIDVGVPSAADGALREAFLKLKQELGPL